MADSPLEVLYASLVRDHGPDLYRMAYRFAGRAAEAEDLVQETFLHAWRSLASLEEPRAARAWLLTILRHRWSHTLRDRGRRPRLVSGEETVAAAPAPALMPRLDVFGERERIEAALERLEPSLKEPFLLVFLAGLSCREAAQCLAVPRGTVLSRLHRARAALRSDLLEADAEGEAGQHRAEGRGS